MWQEKVGEHLMPSDGVQVSVELHQGLCLVVGQPDCSDTLQRKMIDNSGVNQRLNLP